MQFVDTSIIMGGRAPDIGNALATGLQSGIALRDARYQGQFRNALAEHGAGAVAGDQTARNALAGFDPTMVQGMFQTDLAMDQTRLGMKATEQQMQLARETGAREAQRYAAELTAAQAAQAAEEYRRQLQPLMLAETPEAWAQTTQAMGLDPAQAPWEMRDVILAQEFGAAEVLDLRAKQQDLTPDQTFIATGETAAGFGLDPNGHYNVTTGRDGVSASAIGGGGTTNNISVDTGENSSAFTKKADENAANRFDAYAADAAQAAALQGDLQILSDLATKIGTGAGAEILATYGPYAQALGLDVANLDEMQLFQAIVDRVSPQMRPPGSGAGSDFDAQQFLSSLPSLRRTTEGNRMISATFNSILRHRIARGDIANRALRGEITWQEADQQIRAIGNPYEAFNSHRGHISGTGQGPNNTPAVNYGADYAAPPPPSIGTVEDGHMFMGGDAGDPSNWRPVNG